MISYVELLKDICLLLQLLHDYFLINFLTMLPLVVFILTKYTPWGKSLVKTNSLLATSFVSHVLPFIS